MIFKRILPVLLLKNRGLYKTRKFRKPSYVGDPINTIKIFNDKGVDELILLDIEASKRGVPPDFDLIKEIASECFMPLSYGGGIRNIEDAENIFSLGVEKICLQSSILNNFHFLEKLVYNFGASSIAVSLDISKRRFFGGYILSSHASKRIDLSLDEMIDKLNAIGIGELVLQQVDNDGVMQGQDLEIINHVANKSYAPVISLGGIGSLSDIKNSFDAGADAVAAGAFFVYHGIHRAVLITYPSENDFNRYVQ